MTTFQTAEPILVVEDDPALRDALVRILRNEGHEVIEAGDGLSALRMSHAHRPCLVVLDYVMPGMDGEMVLEALREQMGVDAPPALLLTTTGRQQQRALQIGAVLGLEKPFRVEDLLAAVASHRRVTQAQAS